MPITQADLLPAYVPVINYFGGNSGSDPGRPDVVVGGPPASQANATNNYAPRSQNAKLLAAVGPQPAQQPTIDIGRSRGAIAPNQRYPVAGDAAVPAPVVTSIAPNTAVHGAQPVMVTITGTGFTPFSQVMTGAAGVAFDATSKYVDATHMTVVIDPRPAVAGTSTVAVEDHSVLSNTNINFTFT